MMKKPIPNKVFYKIGEVAQLLEVEPYVLRYWEGEFNLRLTKSKNRQRLYQHKDIEQLQRIKGLLYDEKFTIAGAKRKLRERKKGPEPAVAQLALNLPTPDAESKKLREALLQIRTELKEFLAQL